MNMHFKNSSYRRKTLLETNAVIAMIAGLAKSFL
jgi:hypothetical protein